MHWRTASVGISCGTTGETIARASRNRSCGHASRAGADEGGTLIGGESGPMRAMVLAAGLGTRLRLLTDDRPKALVEINGRTLLEITLRRLRSFGIQEVIVNVHHFADLVVAYLKQNGNF